MYNYYVSPYIHLIISLSNLGKLIHTLYIHLIHSYMERNVLTYLPNSVYCFKFREWRTYRVLFIKFGISFATPLGTLGLIGPTKFRPFRTSAARSSSESIESCVGDSISAVTCKRSAIIIIFYLYI